MLLCFSPCGCARYGAPPLPFFWRSALPLSILGGLLAFHVRRRPTGSGTACSIWPLWSLAGLALPVQGVFKTCRDGEEGPGRRRAAITVP